VLSIRIDKPESFRGSLSSSNEGDHEPDDDDRE